ncbi:NAD(P)H-binding protein [Micromonospora sp. NPDC018662]|uniref:NmrA family NAD(P)-binding protein n=1 Tax=Micromonospora sp. NPDC018662 TaxID=3364238 RepID=UPI003792570D
MTTPILVTGATGRVGTELVRLLDRAGVRPRALVRDVERARTRLGDRAELVAGDLGRPADLDAALAGVDRMFVLTATGRGQLTQERNAIDAAVRAGVRHVVKLSVLDAGRDSPLRHGVWQGDANALLVNSPVRHTVLQLAFFMQNLFGMVGGGAIRSSAGDGRVAMVDARDVAAAVAATLVDCPDWAYDRTLVLSGPEALSFDDTAKVLAEATGLPVRHLPVPREQVAAMLRRFGAEEWYAEDVAVFNDLIAAGRVATVTDTVRRLTGSAPRSLADFAREHAPVLARAAAPAPAGRPGG